VPAADLVAAAQRRADAFAEARIRRIRELSDRLVATAETLDRRFAEATEIREQLGDLVSALGAAAERIAGETEGFEPAADPQRLTPRRLVEVLDVAQTAPGRSRA
jgi:hypothetical protein